jgi:hypothetical protein
MQPTTVAITSEAQATFVEELTARMADLARQVSAWVAAVPRTLAEMEEHTLAVTKELGQTLLTGVCQLAASPAPAAHAACTCGQVVPSLRLRTADVLSVLGPIRVCRPVYWCRACRRTFAPFDVQTGLCPSSISAGLDELWDEEVGQVLTVVQATGSTREAVTDALSYLTNNQNRMRYTEYRARGIQIGSGVIESGCNHVIGARLKQAGMIWNVDGARAVMKVRTWLKGRRWAEAMALCPPLRRASQRKVA